MRLHQKKISFFQKNILFLFSTILAFFLMETSRDNLAVAQTNNQNSTADSLIGDFSDLNNVNQNTLQNQNVVSFPDRLVQPLDSPIYTPPNTENDLGFNFSAGVNTLDASNVTLYFGLIFHPGRTASHKARMAQILKKTELLELERQTMEGKLKLLNTQIEEAEVRLQKAK